MPARIALGLLCCLLCSCAAPPKEGVAYEDLATRERFVVERIGDCSALSTEAQSAEAEGLASGLEALSSGTNPGPKVEADVRITSLDAGGCALYRVEGDDPNAPGRRLVTVRVVSLDQFGKRIRPAKE